MTKRRDVNLQVTCCICNKVHTLKVTQESAIEYLSPNRGLIQNIFPYLKPEERELLISNVCPVCWNDLFPPEDEIEGDWSDFQ